MKSYYLNSTMRTYTEKTEEIIRAKPKHDKEWGVRRPDNAHLVPAGTALVTIAMILSLVLL